MAGAESLIGKTISHYRVVEKLGGGGMGVVYKAEDVLLHRFVALKFLPENTAQDRRALDRFRREAQAASALDHPNICTIYEIGEETGQLFIAMQYLEGQTLRGRIGGRPMAVQSILELGAQIAGGLEAAHAKGVIHRDMKPDNVFVTRRGDAKILDFGLAKLVDAGGAGEGSAEAATLGSSEGPLTNPGAAVGTVAYMSPEQVRGEELDARADLFSFGLVLYEMATGRQAFTGSTAGAIHYAILSRDPIPAGRINPEIPEELDAIIRKALEKDRKLRYQHAADLRTDLERLKRDLDSGRRAAATAEPESSGVATAGNRAGTGSGTGAAHTPGSSAVVAAARRHKWAFASGAAIVLAVLAAAGWGIYSFLSPTQPAPAQPVPFQNFQVSQVTNSGDSTAAAISPDGKYILSVKTDAGRQSLWLHNVASGSETQVIAPAATGYMDLTFSPDGNFIYFKRMVSGVSTSFDLFRAPVLGGTPQDVAHDVDSNITFSPDGKSMAYLRGNDPEVGQFRVLTAALDGSNETVQYSGPLSESTVRAVAWRPKGKRLAWSQSIGQGGIGLFDLATKEVRSLGAPGAMITEIVWAPDGSGLFVVYQKQQTAGRKQIGFVAYPSGKFTPLTRDTNDYPSFSLSGDGKTIATVQQMADFHVVLLSSAGAEIPTPAGLAAATQNVNSFAWDGESLLANKGPNVVRISRDGKSSTTLIHNPVIVTKDVAGCPATHSVVISLFTAHGPDGTLWRVDASGTNPVQLTHGELDYSPVCSGDGKWVYYADAAHSRLMRVPLAGNGPGEVVPGTTVRNAILGSYVFGLSPDAKRLAFLVSIVDPATKAVSNKIAVLDIGSGKPARLINPDPRAVGGPIFSPNGKMLTYEIAEGGVNNIWVQPLNGSPGHQLTHFTSEQMGEFRWSPDGRELAVSRGHTNSNIVLLRSQP